MSSVACVPTFVCRAFLVEQWMGRLVSAARGDRRVAVETMVALSCEVKITASVPVLTWIVNVAATNIAYVAAGEDDVAVSFPAVEAAVPEMVEMEIVGASWRVKALDIFVLDKVLEMKGEITAPECSLHCSVAAEAVVT